VNQKEEGERGEEEGHARAGLGSRRAKGMERWHGARWAVVVGKEREGGPTLGAPCGGGTGGPSRVRHVARWREAPDAGRPWKWQGRAAAGWHGSRGAA
jgi:hypothetical protein